MDNRLADALIHDLSLMSYSVPSDNDDASYESNPPTVENYYGDRSYLSLLNEKIDWSADLVRKAIRDDIYINEDLTCFTSRVTVFAVVPSAPHPSFSIKTIYEDGDRPVGDKCYYDIKGASSGKYDSYEEDGAIVHGVQLYLPDNLVPGELHEISYTWGVKSPAPLPTIGERIFPWVVEYYSCSVTFEGEVPPDLEYVTYSSSEEIDNPSPSGIPIIRENNSVRVTAKNFGYLSAYFCCSST